MSSLTIYGFGAIFMFAFAEHHGEINSHPHRRDVLARCVVRP